MIQLHPALTLRAWGGGGVHMKKLPDVRHIF